MAALSDDKPTVPPAGTLTGPASLRRPCAVVASHQGIPMAEADGAGVLTLATAAGDVSGAGAVLRYLARVAATGENDLEGDTAIASGEIDSWVEFATNSLGGGTADEIPVAMVQPALDALDAALV